MTVYGTFIAGINSIWHFWSLILKIFDIFSTKFNFINDIEVLHQSENFLVINKPHDIVINSNDHRIKNSLHIILHKKFPQLANPKLKHLFYFVHRLDYATSGVLCIPLNKKACIAAATSFSERRVKKYYLALVRGLVARELLQINVAIGEDKREESGNHRMCVFTDPHCEAPRIAYTKLLVLQRGLYDSYPATKVLLTPVTGRRHQLRIHCSHIGHTIVGDYTYSNRRDTHPHRTFLHAYRLIVPNTLEDLDIQTQDPFSSNLKQEHGWCPIETWNQLNSSTFKKLED